MSLYAHLYSELHEVLKHLEIEVIVVTDANKPSEQEGFWIEKLST